MRTAIAARLESVLEYIDAHCGEALPIEQLARRANVSPFHFHRVFSAYLGESVSTYVRRRTLERAARELKLSGRSVSACGEAAGYASAASFARAFQRQFGTSPSRLRVELDALPASGRILLPDGPPELRELPALDVSAVRRAGAWPLAPVSAWQALAGTLQYTVDDPANLLYIGIPGGHPELDPRAPCQYYACMLAGQGESSGIRKRVAGGHYAVFRYEGRYSGLAHAHATLLWRYAPRHGLRLRDDAPFHCFTDLGRALAEDVLFEAEILLPVVTRPHAGIPTQRTKPAASSRAAATGRFSASTG